MFRSRLAGPVLHGTCQGLLLAGLCVSAADAQEDQIFLEQVDVSVVNVEVFVTDEKGQRITDLTQGDFQVLEDGEPVHVSNFSLVRGGSIDPPPVAPTPDGTQASPKLAPIEPKQVHLVVFVDDENLAPSNRNQVLVALQSFVREKLRPSDRIMLVSSDGDFLIQKEMSADPDELVAALDDMSRRAGKGALLNLERQAIVRDIHMVDLPGDVTGAESQGGNAVVVSGENTEVAGGSASGFRQDHAGDEAQMILEAIRAFAQREHNMVRDTIAGLRQFVSSLSGVPGRKAVLYVSDGLSMRPGEELFYAWENKFNEYARDLGISSATLDATELRTDEYFEELVETANASEVTFYALRPAGGGTRAAVTGQTPAILGSQGSRHTQVWSPGVDAVASANAGSPMRFISEATGGFALVNSRNFDGMLDRMREDFDTYYSLGYAVDHTDDELTHRIQIVVSNPKWSVRHRERYRHKTREEQTADLTLSALLLDVESNPLQIKVEFGQAEPADKGDQLVVPVIVKVPISKLVLLPQGEYHVGQIKIAVAAKDGSGRSSPVRMIEVPVRIRNEQLLTAMSQVATYRVKLGMRKTKSSVAVGVHDSLANVDSATSVMYEPPAAS